MCPLPPKTLLGVGPTAKKSLGMGEGLDAEREEGELEPGRGQGCHSRVTAVSQPCHHPALAAEDAALPGTPHPQGRRLEPAPSPSELLIGVFSSGAALLELTPSGNSGTPAALRSKTRPRAQLGASSIISNKRLSRQDLAGNYTGSGAQSRREGRNLPACKDLCPSPHPASREGVPGTWAQRGPAVGGPGSDFCHPP